MKEKTFALVSNDIVRWLISREPELCGYIRSFARDEAPQSFIDVAGPPDIGEMARCRANAKRQPMLPVVRLHLRKMKHHLTGEDGIEVKCSDDHCDEILSWHNQARFRAAMQNAAAGAVQ